MADVLAFPTLGTSTPARVDAVVAAISAHLAGARMPDAAREARDIVAAIVDMPRFWPSMNREAALDTDLCARAWEAARRRASGAPFAYAVGRAAFRHLTLDVDERVLIPRQETEALVECVLARVQHGVALDIGTGSGAIALALATEGHFTRVIATDVSREALAVARSNTTRLSRALRAPVELRHGSLLAPVGGERASALVSNPPYIAFDEAAMLPASVRDWEPPVALLTSRNGMAAIASLIRGGAHVLEPGGLLALEIDERRASLAAELAMSDGRYVDVRVERDLAGRERILLARKQ
ncbi:MAG TPA: peptide chain release factor N(5)-glutamine methyltransferase [Gemmatimonadaceae bacterium]|nr:peptide chain release factor N(5)-glutamine methyltransferase [Gemmatimonadaceae bacterium]